MYGTTRENANRAAAHLNATRIGEPALFGHGRTARGYIVQPHAFEERRGYGPTGIPCSWGVVERWTYDDRPDLPEFGGAFVWLTPDMLSCKRDSRIAATLRLEPGQQVETSGYRGTVRRLYSDGPCEGARMYEVLLPGGLVCICGSDINPV